MQSLSKRANAKLLHHIGAVDFNLAHSDSEISCYFAILVAINEAVQHVSLAPREAGYRRWSSAALARPLPFC
jgi:hypothetical protein